VRILVTGCRGQLGKALLAELADAHDVTGVDLAQGDLAAPGVAAGLVADAAPVWTLHAAAFTDVDGAETQPDAAEAGNVRATAELAAACTLHGSGLCYVSTDYVFAGDAAAGYAEDAPREPLNRYGATKAAGETVVEALAAPWQIVRTSWLFGHAERNFVRTIRRLLRERETLRVVDDQHGRPTYAPDLAATLRCLVERDARGIFHATNAGDCTWHGFAREIARLSGADPDRIEPCATAAYPTPARRPAHSILLSRRLEAVGCPARPPWQDALARYIAWLDAHVDTGGGPTCR
jgi:dTDP-4-dehydrorhamnose reductase